MSNEIHQGILNVRWFAGVGSGDETVRIQAALDHPTADAILFSANGVATTYTVTGLTVRRSKRIIIDRGVTVRLADLSNASVFRITAANVTMEGEGAIDGNRDNQTSGHGIFVAEVDGVKIEGLTVTDCVEYGIRADSASRFWVRDCTVARTTNTGIALVERGADPDVEDFRVVGCNVDRSDDAANNEKCIKVGRELLGGVVRGVLIQGNYLKMHETPTGSNVACIEVFASDDVDGGILHPRIMGNFTRGSSIAISVASRTRYASITNNIVQNAASIGIEVADSSYCTVAGNSVTGNNSTDNGISIDGQGFAAAGCSVSGNTVENVAASGACIVTTGATPYLAITGNAVTTGAASSRGILVNGSSDIRIAGNYMDGTDTAGTGLVIINGSRVDIGENSINRWGAQRIQIVASGGTAVTQVRVDESNRLEGTHGGIQVLEQTGGTVNEVVAERDTTTPAQLTADVNNYHPSVDNPYAGVWRLSSDASRTITGIARGFAWRRITIFNIGSNEIILADQSGSSSAANRIDTGSGAAVSLLAGDAAQLVYDHQSSLWRVVGTN
jgi:parallel beta-helix repeat protein